MERNRPVTIFGVITIMLVCVAAILACFCVDPDHPVRTSLLSVVVILSGVAALTAINFLMFVPLFMFIARLCGKNRKSENAEHGGGG